MPIRALMKKIIKLILIFSICTGFLTSCALFNEVNNEYTIRSSKVGARVFSQSGKLLGNTPIHLGFEEIKDAIDGKFATLVIQKEGYNTRVLMFDISDSVNVKIDLEIDKNYSTAINDGLYKVITKLEKDNEKLFQQNIKLTQEVSHTQGRSSTYQEQIRKLQMQESLLLEKIKGLTQLGKISSKQPLSVSRVPASMPVKSPVCKDTVIKRVPYKSKDLDQVISKVLGVQFMIIKGDYKTAKKEILTLEEKYPRFSTIYTLLGYVEMQERNFPKAYRYLKKSLRLNKDDQMAKRLMVMVDSGRDGVIK